MANEGGQRGGSGGDGVRPGQLSALLQEIAAAPTPPDGGWGAALLPGATVGKFELVREIGSGGFGVVWEARDRELGRSVAFKAVRAGGKAGLREERLLREAEAAARLSHPNLVTLFDMGRSEAGPYLVMELLAGQTLEERLAQGPLPLREAVRIAAEVARGAAHAHQHGVVHRDLKPANVFLCEDGQVKVLDFGLAHAFGQRRQDGGTPAYMAPEQWEGAPEDERTDVFALGVMLFRMLSGDLPFADAGGKDHGSQEPAPALDIAGQPALGELVARMLAKRPVERPRDGVEVAATLAAIRGELERAPASGATAVRTRRRPGLRLAGLALGGLVVGALLAGGAMWWRLARAPQPMAGADGRIVVAVADFANETGEKELDALSGLLITSLEQSRHLRLLTRSRMFDLLREGGRDGLERIDEVAARDVGRRAGARALLLASVRRFDDLYALELRALDPAADEYLFAVKEQVSGRRALPEAIDRLSERVRRSLREPGAEVERSGIKVAEAVTGNLEAYRHYFEALRHEDQYRFREAREELLAALREEPGFVLAHLRLAVPSAHFAPPLPAGERAGHLRAAFEGAGRLPARDRLVVTAEMAWSDGRTAEAEQLYEQAIELRGDDKRTLLRLAYLRALTTRFAAGRTLAERALALDPSWPPAQDYVAIALVFGGEPERALALVRGWTERWPSFLTFGILNGVLLHLAQPEAALPPARRALELSGGSDNGVLARTLFMAGDLAGVEREARRAWQSGDRGGSDSLPFVLQARGRRRESLALAAELERGGLAEQALLVRVTAAAGDGDGARLRALVSRAGALEAPSILAAALLLGGAPDAAAPLLGRRPPDVHGDWRELHEGLLPALRSRAAGDLAGARGALEALRQRLSPPPARAAAYLLGETCHLAGKDDCAVEALAEFLRHRWLVRESTWTYPRSLQLSALSLERLGRRNEAREMVERLMALLQEADADLPLLLEAQTIRARLSKAPAPAKGAAAVAPPPSIAVLPFVDMSPGKDQEYFADGVAEEILNALTQVPGLKVIGRTSSFSFKGKSADLKAIGAKLGASALLEGSVRKDGARLRVTAKLVQAADGAGTWSRTFEGDQGTIFAVQDEIARSVVEALRLSLEPGRTPSRPIRTDKPDVYASYLRGREQYRRGTPESLRQALASFEQTLEREPGYAPAWAGVSEAAFLLFDADPAAPDLRERALSAAEKAIALAPDLADGYYARAVVRIWYRLDWAGAEADLLRVAALNPGHARGPSVRGRLLAAIGRMQDGLALAREATAIDPLDPEVWVNLGVAHAYGGDLAQARAAYGRAHRLAPAHYLATGFLSAALVADGKPREALALAERSNSEVLRLLVEALARHDLGDARAAQAALDSLAARYAKWGAYFIASVHAWREENDRAFEWLERALGEYDGGLANVRRDPLFQKLHADPRWPVLLRKLNLPVE